MLIVLKKRRDRRKKLRKNGRRFHMHEIYAARPTFGEFHHLFAQLRGDEKKFHEYFRLSPMAFDLLLSKVQHRLVKRSRRLPIQPVERLAVTLRFLATGQNFNQLMFSWRMATNTVSLIVHECCMAIWEELREEYLKTPSTVDEWQQIAQDFWDTWQFPNCIGAIDGKHCVLKKPAKSGSLYFNYKGSCSIVLMAACDAKYRFIYIDVGSFGHNNDGGIFASSKLHRLLQNGSNLPPPSKLPGTNIVSPYTMVGDGAFPLKTFMMKPFAGQHLSPEANIFNYRLSRARRLIENVFGIMSCTWRVLLKPIETTPAHADKIVLAICALHNFLLTEEPNKEFVPTAKADFEVNGVRDRENGIWRTELAKLRPTGSNGPIGLPQAAGFIQPRQARRFSKSAEAVRRDLVTYFQNTAPLPWQLRRTSAVIG